MRAAPGFVATEPAIAGNPLYFTGIQRFDLVHSQYVVHAQVFATPEAAQAAVRPWNDLGHQFTVSTAPAGSAP